MFVLSIQLFLIVMGIEFGPMLHCERMVCLYTTASSVSRD
jgi:hypothetical protein